jgi:magnesium transporter
MRQHETVGGHVVASILRARREECAGDVLARLAAEKPAPCRRRACFAAQEKMPLGQIIDLNFPRVRPNTDQERAASLALHHGVDALAVGWPPRWPAAALGARARRARPGAWQWPARHGDPGHP